MANDKNNFYIKIVDNVLEMFHCILCTGFWVSLFFLTFKYKGIMIFESMAFAVAIYYFKEFLDNKVSK